MLTGKLPHTGEKAVAVALKHINERITPPISVNDRISMAANNIVLKATSKNPKDRYRSAEAFKADLQRAFSEPDGEFVDIPKALSAEAKAKMHGRQKMWKVGILALLLLIAGAAVYLGFSLFSKPTVTAKVLNMVGMTMEDAEILMANDDLTANVVYEPNETADEGIVVSQSVAEGTRLSKGSSVTLTVSSGPAGMVMPDLMGKSYDEAVTIIESMGLEPADVTYELREDVPQGEVIEQMPEADTPISRNELVSLIVSGEAPQEGSLIPSVKDLAVDQAVSLLQSLGFTNCVVYEQENEATAGTVFNQSPVEGTQTLYSDEVILYVSAYASKYHSGSFSETFEVTEKGSQIRVVLVDMINGVSINFKVYEDTPTDTTVHIDLPLSSFASGYRTVIVYINNVEASTYNILFT
jgi:serine/threonine-protein kinase